MRPIKLYYLDTGFWRMSQADAKRLCGGTLPHEGCEKAAVLETPAKFITKEFGKWAELPQGTKLSHYKHGWVTRTRCAFFDGKPNPQGWVWAFYGRRGV
jgi:hypothetical protein